MNMKNGDEIMNTTKILENNVTERWGDKSNFHSDEKLMNDYNEVLKQECLKRDECLRFLKTLGKGGQGIVYLSERIGCDHFSRPVAVKVFSPERYETTENYIGAMGQLANVAAKVSCIQHDNLLDVHNWVAQSNIRMMEMEWVDGFDLEQILDNDFINRTKAKVSKEQFNNINEVIITAGGKHSRLKPGIAIAVIRECLSALSALHRHGIIHGDIKPANIMLKRTGHVKIVDIGSAFEVQNQPVKLTCTPAFAAPEVLGGEIGTPQSDLASLGYVLIELLSGSPPFEGKVGLQQLLEAKHSIAVNLHNILPPEVVSSELLMNFCGTLIAPDPSKRFPSAEAADLFKEGAANFQRQLIKGDLASEYDNEIRLWLEEL